MKDIIKMNLNYILFDKKILRIIILYSFLLLGMSIIITLILHDKSDLFGKKYTGLTLNSFIENIYFSFTTISTIGYGDIYPLSLKAKITVTLITSYSYILLYTFL